MYKLKTNPWLHQWKALDYLMVRDHAALFTDMGSGKTKVMIDLIVNRGFKFVLIIGTKKSCDVWEKEFEIHSDLKNCVFNLCNHSTPDKLSIMKEKLHSAQILGVPAVFINNYESIWREPLKPFLYKHNLKVQDDKH